jgi:hypothetical protein
MNPSADLRVLCCLLATLCGCAPVVAEAPAAAAITAISLERDCPGCPTGSTLVLRRDGTAIYTLTGKARLGTADQASRGKVAAQDFDRLAQLAVSQGFFALDDQYEDDQNQDGAWTTTAVTRGGQDKRVFRRDAAGPAALLALEKAIDALRARIQFQFMPENR